NYNEEAFKKNINILNNNESYFLNGMNDIVYQYENESNEKIKIIGKTENILFYLTLIMVVFITLFIFIPAEKSLLKAFKDIKESNDNMIKLFKTVHGAMFLIDEKTEEILFMNKSAEKLIEVNTSDTDKIYFQEIFKLKYDAFYKVMDKIKLYEKNENVEFNYENTDSGVGTFILSSVKMNFNNKPAILIGLFDITEQKQAEENFRNIAIKDKLTGLFNRYYFDLRVNDEIIISERYNEPLTMILLDLDHFKNINDTWGHPVGDIVLKETSEIISSAIRKSDYVFRVGGEEFIVLMPKTEINDALFLADKIRVEVENNDYSVAKKVTVSIGAAQKYKSESLDNWYARTDKALYFAKESGRNCVVNYENMNNKIIAFAHIEWSNQWDSKNKEIDNQHKKLIEIANTLLFMAFSNNMDKIIKQLDLLINHIINHFDFEEKLLSEIGYPNYEEHITIHKELLQKSLNLREAYINEKFSVTEFFSFVVDDIVLGHMIKDDEKFFDLIRNYEISNNKSEEKCLI
ncbi:MAG: diguanylate cyclase with sensor, partial [Bacillota bacterium]|nr:diguanylate cyclase with sensor [Bacillota bacterium]